MELSRLVIDNADRLSEDNVLEKFGVFDKCGKIISDSVRGLAMTITSRLVKLRRRGGAVVKYTSRVKGRWLANRAQEFWICLRDEVGKDVDITDTIIPKTVQETWGVW